MTVLAADRNTPFKGDNRQISMKVAASTQIYKGAIVCASATGFLIPAADTAGLIVVGIAEENVDNTGGADGDLSCIVQKGVAGLRGGTTPPVQADVGRAVYVEDDAGIETGSGSVNKIQAGILDSLGSDGLFYVKIFDETEGANLPVGSVDTAELADLAVTTAKLGADAVDGTKIADLAVDTEHLAALSVETAKIALDAVDGTLIADNAIANEHLADDAVTSVEIDQVVSGELTGSGSEQDFAHGLGGVPGIVLAILTEFADTLAVDIAYGAHDGTNAKVTITSGAKYKLLVIL